jgi:hypothetical protein
MPTIAITPGARLAVRSTKIPLLCSLAGRRAAGRVEASQ